MINAEVLRRKANLGSDRSFVDNFDFLYSSQMVKKMFAFFFAMRMGQGFGLALTLLRFVLGVIAVIPIYFILVLVQLYLSAFLSIIRMFKAKNLLVDGSFILIFIFIHNLILMPYTLYGGDLFWLNTYVFKLPTWLFNAVIYV